jgi:hypothetical protein
MTRGQRRRFSFTRSFGRRVQPGDDTGATLVFALIFITVVAVGVGAVLTLTDASLRATVALRAQTRDAAAADGAAQVAVNSLRKSQYNGTGTDVTNTCLGAGDTLTLSNFYVPQSGPAQSATIVCRKDAGKSVLAPYTAQNTPAYALHTSFWDGFLIIDRGINLDLSNDFHVKGRVLSAGAIEAGPGELIATGSVDAWDCDPSWEVVSESDQKNCRYRGSTNYPNWSVPTGPTVNRTVPTCTGRGVYQLFPGRYDSGDVDALNELTNDSWSIFDRTDCDGSVVFLHPGDYYLDFNDEWVIGHATVIGGGDVVPTLSTTVPGACPSPIPPNTSGSWRPPVTSTGGNPGVQLVFGRESKLVVSGSPSGSGSSPGLELCGGYSKNRPPIVLYGLTNGMPGIGGGPGVAGQSCGPFDDCGLEINRYDNPKVYFHGTVAMGEGRVFLNTNTSSQVYFRGGVLAHRFDADGSVQSSAANPIVSVPDIGVGPNRTVVLLDVYLCQGSSPCATTGEPRLQAKVAINDASASPVAGQREVTVLSWSVLR